MTESPRRAVLTAGGVGIAAIGINFLGVTSAMLAVAPDASRKARLDAYYPIQGFKRCVDPEGGRFTFIYPVRLLADRQRYQQERRAKGLPIPLTPGMPIVAFGDGPRGFSFGGDESVSLVVAALRDSEGRSGLPDWYRDPAAAGDWLIRRTLYRAPERRASLIDARTARTPSGSQLYLIEYTVEAPSDGQVHSLVALGVTRSESFVTLSYRVPADRWAEREADVRMTVASFDL